MRKKTGIFILLSLLVTLTVSCNSLRPSSSNSAISGQLASAEAVKLKITQEGIYRVNLSDFGWEASTFDSLSLTHKGQPVSYEIQTTENMPALIFFGQVSDSLYTPNNFYVLKQNANNKLLMETKSISVSLQSPSDIIIHTIHLEENHLYTPKVTDGSPWHWEKIIAPKAHISEVDLLRVADGAGQLRVALWGATSALTSPDHHVRVLINGLNVGEAAWDDQIWQIINVQIPDGVLVEGRNIIEVQATGEVEARIDIINLDWIEIDYPKYSDKITGQEIFHPQEENVELTGIEGPLDIFDISNPEKIVRLEVPTQTAESIKFQGHPEHLYLAVEQDAYYSPDQILPLTEEPDLRTASGASYLAIGYPELLAPLDPLLQTREEQGISTWAIPIETIYDQFNDGMPEPEAVRDFLGFATENWETPPRYILLVGDTSYDFYGYQTPLETNLLPTFLVPTIFGGETGSDVRFAQIDNESLWPQLAIGRVPARNAKQVETFVEKTMDYEQKNSGLSQNKVILAIADGQEPTFKRDATHFVEQFTEDYQAQIIAPEAGAQGTNQQIADEIEQGTLITAYFGHGSVNMWGKDSLFTTQDSAALENSEHLSIVWNFTCLTGLFTHPTEESLAESLLFNPKGGAVAVLAPTSPTLPSDQTFLSDALVEALIQNPAYRLGDITLYAWQQVPTLAPGPIDVMQTFLLFGDPALRLPSP